MNVHILLKLLGGLIAILSLILIIPGLYAYSIHEPAAQSFLSISAIGCILGCLVFTLYQKHHEELNHRTGIAIVGCTWMAAGILGALPYYFSNVTPSFVDAIFESISGFSGTGASVLSNLEELPKSILLWRSMTQWLGGMGIIVFFIAILPILGIGGVQLFRAEITGPSKDKITPRVRETAKKLWVLYLGLTIILTIILAISGMTVFDAINHAMTTLSTGGFSTRSNGIAAFHNPQIEYVIAIFMLISSMNFSLYFMAMSNFSLKAFLRTEAKWYLAILSIMTILCTLSIWNRAPGETELEQAFRDAFFTIVCTASSTGFTNVDYLNWPVSTHALIVLLMVMGGMSGSTAGGIKCIRIVATIKQLFKEIKQVVHPRAFYTIKVNNQSIPEQIISAIWGFVFLYFAIFSAITVFLTFQGLDLLSASTASFSALSNIGPAFGEFGPYSNYANLSDTSKFVLTAGMLLGRLEFYTLMVLFTFEYWRK